jgi:hypothetical protein
MTLHLVKRRDVLISASAALIAACGPRAVAPSRPTSYPAELAANPAVGVWPTAYRTAPDAVRTAYQYAAANYETLRYIPCFCGCGLSAGHLNNYDCFVKAAKPDGWFILDPHGLVCGTCVAITLDVITMRGQGMTAKGIRTAIDDRWAETGPSTRTPYP